MTGFTSGKGSKDPEPYVGIPTPGGEGIRLERPPVTEGWEVFLDPRPEYDNHNPVLVELRWDISVIGDPRWAVKNQLDALAWGEWNTQATWEQRQHARRVLEKLEAFYAETKEQTTW
ncbi:hypothetical protein [Leifsonia aquatica]|uniref:hypothetical protein n=1 Tax=Leifsonia aquatica TaxID=144185 RepID=UPI000468DA50|nr:hypothetical protein [Leifsonia aquatica]